uniref:Uncharacterized protein n=1 Tax=Arundo donax TaxID=35708 RepID=A0A0A8YMC7_ARUDO
MKSSLPTELARSQKPKFSQNSPVQTPKFNHRGRYY